jgi:glycogen operon protein
MFVMGDEFARSQRGHDNPYDVDGPLSWVDWSQLEQWRDLHADVRRLVGIRRRLDHDRVHVHGANGGPDYGYESRSLAWHSGEVYVMANAWWQPLEFSVVAPGAWHLEFATSPVTQRRADGTVVVAPRSMAVLCADPVGERPA